MIGICVRRIGFRVLQTFLWVSKASTMTHSPPGTPRKGNSVMASLSQGSGPVATHILARGLNTHLIFAFSFPWRPWRPLRLTLGRNGLATSAFARRSILQHLGADHPHQCPNNHFFHIRLGQISFNANWFQRQLVSMPVGTRWCPIVLRKTGPLLCSLDISSGRGIMAEDWARQIGLDRRSQ